MAGKRSRRIRRDNVACPLDLEVFVRELGKALNWDGKVSPEGRLTPDRLSGARWNSHSSGRFAVNYLMSELLSKFDDGLPSPDKDAMTWARFYEAEELSKQTNVRLLYDRSGFSTDPRSVVSLIEVARRKISHIVGEFDWDLAARGFNFGPGATTRLPRRKRDAAYKYSGTPETTIGNLALAIAAISAIPLWKESLFSQGESHPKVVMGNKIVTVPKNYKTDRVIAIEPCMNMYIQKGIGGLLRSRLKRHGVDLNDQSRNQVLASKGVELGLATIDLSLASDTVSYEIVRALMPPDWFAALEQCRSQFGVLPSGERILYRKFSSMGNGYTFELESVIFYGLCLAVAEVYGLETQNIAVYGDDIIFPATKAKELCDLLQHAGFRPNEKKSHLDGPFRESCGKHYHSGYDVSPFYIKRSPKTLRELFLLHNQLYRWCVRNQWNPVWHRGKMRSLIRSLRGSAPRAWRKPQLPDGFGDGAFIGTFDETRPSYARKGYEGFRCRVLLDFPVHGEYDQVGRLLKSLHQLEQSSGYLTFLSEASAEGGVSLPPRVRRSEIVVPRFAGEDPFLIFFPR